jgi:23S rRNA pseudouridine2604 synthase
MKTAVSWSSAVRLNRYFTDQGICSRREADKWIENGRITLNGKIAKLGDQVNEGDEILLDGKALPRAEKKPVLLAFNKPPGVECTSDPTVENNIIEAVNYPERIFHIGRLDKMSEGLILLTNMGEVVNKILRRRYGHEKEYIVVLNDIILDAQILKLSRGVELDDGFTSPCKVYRLGGRRIGMVLTEGHNRQIRRMAEAIGLRVVRLKRIRVMNIPLGDLPRGRWRLIEGREYQDLMTKLEAVGDDRPICPVEAI